jgi:flagellar hook-associated protein 3 FlgL
MTRVPDSLMYAKGQDALNRSRDTMIRNQEKGLTGKRINRPSDDPVASMRVIQTQILEDRDATVTSNLEVASGFLNLTDASLGELSDVLSRLKELSLQMASGTNSTADARESVKKEVDQLALRIVQIGNTRFGDRYIFGGHQTDKAPFDADGNYFGDEGKLEVEMDRGQRITVNVAGVAPFFGVSEITEEAQETRMNPLKDKVPSISGNLREPASIAAANQGIDPEEQPKEYEDLKNKLGVNLFGTIKQFSEGLANDNKVAITDAIDNIEKGFQQVLATRAQIGARQNILKLSLDSLDASRVTLAEIKSGAQDADTIQVYSDLAKNETVLKSTLEVNRKLLQPSLMDFLK